MEHVTHSTRFPAELDRCRGCLYGLAVGDALGAAVEFMEPAEFQPVTGYRDGGPHRLNAGQWTDDTSMALALADSIVSAGWDLNDQARRYCEWRSTGKYSVNRRCFDIGIQTSAALRRFAISGDAWSSGPTAEQTSGNGSIMRLAPVPIAFLEMFPTQILGLAKKAEESSIPTHASAQCRSACRYLAVVLAGLLRGVPREEVLCPDWKPLAQLLENGMESQVRAVAMGSYLEKEPPAIRGAGWVVQSLEAALWAFHGADSFERAVLRAVNLGDDADTTGAVCGQLAGACWGLSDIPRPLVDGLDCKDMIDAALRGLQGPRD